MLAWPPGLKEVAELFCIFFYIIVFWNGGTKKHIKRVFGLRVWLSTVTWSRQHLVVFIQMIMWKIVISFAEFSWDKAVCCDQDRRIFSWKESHLIAVYFSEIRGTFQGCFIYLILPKCQAGYYNFQEIWQYHQQQCYH